MNGFGDEHARSGVDLHVDSSARDGADRPSELARQREIVAENASAHEDVASEQQDAVGVRASGTDPGEANGYLLREDLG